MTPNTPSQKDTISSMIRVNHAGEYGAVRIYQGQLDALKGTASENTIRHMQDQERVHLAAFDQLIQKRHVRPTALSPLWHVAGYALGYVTGKLGGKAAMACTVAVETVIDGHYQTQEKILSTIPQEQDLYETIQKFRQEEAEHKETALEEGAEQAPGYDLLSTVIQGASRLAIFLSKRI